MAAPLIHPKSDTPVLLMCSPEFYAIAAPDAENGAANHNAVNGYEEYRKNPTAFRQEAKRQWSALRDLYEAVGARIVEIDPVEGLDDLCFTADPSLTLITCTPDDVASPAPTDVTIFSHFSNEERAEEVGHSVRFFEDRHPERTLVRHHFKTEGTGDNFYDPFRDVFWSGYTGTPGRKNADSGRSDIRSHRTLRTTTGVDVVSLEVKKPYFHIDTSMTPLSRGHIICYKNGMKPSAYKTLLHEAFDRFGMPRDEFLIEVDKKDAAAFACNLRCFDNDVIVMPECSGELQDRLRGKGYKVITTAMTQFIHSGGAMHCLSNNVNERRVIGGRAKQFGFERKLAA